MFVVVLGVTGWLYVAVPKGFIPDTDNDNFSVQTESAQGTSFYQMVKYQQMVSQIMVRDPDVESFYSSTGGGFGGAANTGRLMVNLKPRRQRVATVADIVNRLRPKVSELSRIAGIHLDSAGHPRGRAHVQEQLRLHALWTGHAAALRGSPQAGAHRRAPAGPAGSVERSANQDPARQRRSGSRPGGGAGCELEQHLQLAVRRIRPAVLFHHLLAHQPVPGPARDAAAVSGTHRRAADDLSEIRQRPTGAAERRGETGDGCRPAEHPALGPTALGHDFIRLAARHLAGPGHFARSRKRPRPLCPPPSPAPSRAPPRSSRIP